MPAKVDKCVEDVLAGWEKKPDSVPESVEGKDGKEKKSAAFAICNARITQNWLEDQDAIELMLGGAGPVLAGVGLTNRPFLKGLPVASVVEEEGKQKIRVPFFRYGRFKHPKAPDGKLVFTPEFLTKMKGNFSGDTYGQKVLLDKAHKPDDGNMGELERIDVEGDIGVAYFDPTNAGLDTVRQREYLYGSMDFFLDWEGNEISMSSSDSGFSEISLSEQAAEDIENGVHIELFNKYHSKKDGRFSSDKGGGKGSGDSDGGGSIDKGSKTTLAKGATITVAGIAGSITGSIYGGKAGAFFAGDMGLGEVGTAVTVIGGSVAGSVFGGAIARGVAGGVLSPLGNDQFSEDADTIQLADDSAKAKTFAAKFLSILKETFKHKDIGALVVNAKKNPGLDKAGFEEEDDNFVLKRNKAEKIISELEKFLSGKKPQKEEANRMSEEKKNVGEETEETPVGITLTQEEYDELRGASTQLTDLQDSHTVILADLQRQRQELYRRDVETFVEKAQLPVDGRSYSKPVVETVCALLLSEPVGEGESIQLSEDSRSDPVASTKYYTDGVRYLLSLIPRDVPVDEPGVIREPRPEPSLELSEKQQSADAELAAYVLGVSPSNGEEE